MYSIRPAIPDDLPVLAQVFLDARVQAFHWCEPSDFQLADFEAQTQGEIIHVAVGASDLPVGFISVWRQDGFIHHLYVDPRHQQRGVGKLLLRSLRGWLPLPHRLKCLLGNAPARSFYLGTGWKDVSVGTDALGQYALMEYGG